MIAVLADYGVLARARPDAPGVYLAGAPNAGAKIGALGLRVRRGRTMHGLALNLNLDLQPFSRINPCGLAGIEVARLCDLTVRAVDMRVVGQQIAAALAPRLGLRIAD